VPVFLDLRLDPIVNRLRKVGQAPLLEGLEAGQQSVDLGVRDQIRNDYVAMGVEIVGEIHRGSLVQFVGEAQTSNAAAGGLPESIGRALPAGGAPRRGGFGPTRGYMKQDSQC